MRCPCAKTMYRNNFDGTQDFTIKGDLRCRKCRGFGRIKKCEDCDGCGMLPGSKKCVSCDGNGVVPIKDRIPMLTV